MRALSLETPPPGIPGNSSNAIDNIAIAWIRKLNSNDASRKRAALGESRRFDRSMFES
jgi:hypothetical protein